MKAEDDAECRCPHIVVGFEVYPTRNWRDTCPVHGVGTEYFRSLKTLPFGYADERATTREEWLAWRAHPPEEEQ